MIFTTITLSFLFFLFACTLKNHVRIIIPINWPFVGMLPHLLLNLHRLFDFCHDILEHIHDKTFIFKGPWFSSMKILATIDPANVHYVMSKNFKNFPKGAKYYEIFEIFGDGIFNTDFELWSCQRRNLHSFFAHPCFIEFLIEIVRRKVEVGLIPILEHANREGHVVDLENLFQRFTFDTICTLVMGDDPESLSIELPDSPFCKALDDVEEALFYRHVVPKSIWKLQSWLGLGKERKLSKAWKILDSFLYKAATKKMEEMSKKRDNNAMDWIDLWLMGDNCVDDDHEKKYTNGKFLRDTFLTMLIAGRDTTSVALTWFFWFISKNRNIENMLRNEVKSIIPHESMYTPNNQSHNFFQVKDIDKLVYLHGALCETLRLYPSLPFQRKIPLEPDILPSGHKVDPTTTILILLHAMGRDRTMWGDDCLEFKPERWITERGRIKHEPSYKFFAFNAGPRTCLGKQMAFIQMKAVASAIFLHGYQFQIVEEPKVEPALSLLLHTKNGLNVKVTKVASSEKY